MDLYTELKQEKQAIREFLDKYWNFKVTPKKQIKTVAFEGTPLCEELQEEYSPITERVILAHGRDCNHVDVLIDILLVQGINWGIQERKPYMNEKIKDVNHMLQTINTTGVIEEKLSPMKVKYFPNSVKPGDFNVDMNSLMNVLNAYFTISAQPKGYRAHKRTAEEFDYCDCKTEFKGSERIDHSLVCDFKSLMCKHGVFYREEREDIPFHTLIRGVSGRGLNLGLKYVENSCEGYNAAREKINKIMSDPENRNKVFPLSTDKDKKALRAKIGKDLNKLMKKDLRGK